MPVYSFSGEGKSSIQTAVPNDDFDSAQEIGSIPFTTTQDIFPATTAVDDPGFPCNSNQQRTNSVWFRFTPTVTGTIYLSSLGSQYTPLMAVWTGTRGSLTNQVCASTSQASLGVIAGTTYTIEIARYFDIIIPAPTQMITELSIWPAGTYPEQFGKLSPLDGNVRQSPRPLLRWQPIHYLTNYAYCIDSVENTQCDSTWKNTNFTSVALSGLTTGTTYYWQVRAVNPAGSTEADDGDWWSFTTAGPADLNNWSGVVTGTTRPTSFNTFKDGIEWLNISVTVPFSGCSANGTAVINAGGPGNITNRAFSYESSSFRYYGTFTSLTTASGTYQLTNYPICVWISPPGYCCYAMTNGSGSWTASGGPLVPDNPVFLPAVLVNP